MSLTSKIVKTANAMRFPTTPQYALLDLLRIRLLGLIALMLLLAGCGHSRPYTQGAVKTFDPDTAAIPMPDEKPENDLWDRIDLTLIYQLEKPLDLNWTGRQIGRALNLANKKQADNVNALDEPPNSSWYTRRHFYHEMSPAELARGPNETGGPDYSGPWTVTSGKLEGAAPGFVIRDARGDTYLLKFSRPPYEEMAPAAEVISTKILYAAGYNVPENYVTFFDPDNLTIAPDAEVRVQGGKRRPMRPADLEEILSNHPRTEDGTVRALASKYIEGRPVGIWNFRGTRGDDPNDRVRHEHRRELRGLRVISAWLNDTDRRSANTLATYTDERYLKHYLIDMGSTLGANGPSPKSPKHGHEYLYDPANITKAFFGLGLYERPWLWIDRDAAVKYPSVGYYTTQYFDPETWKPVYPNPAFERMTLRDAYWGAKQVMSFTDEDLQAIVETAELSNPEAEAYLLDVLQKRRDEIGRYYFGRTNPLDRFRFTRRGGEVVLAFDDLAVEGDLAAASERCYAYRAFYDGNKLHEPKITADTEVSLALEPPVASGTTSAPREHLVRVDLWTKRTDGSTSKRVSVYGLLPNGGEPPRLVGVQREED